MEYPAHIRYTESGERIVQTVGEHCRETAEYAKERLSCVNLAKSGYLAGLLHDAGKYTAAFRDYIERAARGEEVRRGSVNHTFAGCRFLLERYHGGEKLGFREIACEILAYAVGAHHGLFDCVDEHGQCGFDHRLSREDVGYDEAVAQLLREISPEELDALFDAAAEEIEAALLKIQELASYAASREEQLDAITFCVGMLVRLIASAVIEGDRLSTARFYGAAEVGADGGRELWERALHSVEEKLGALPRDTAVRASRAKISDLCAEAASRPGGVYRLDLPTGGGKTLSSLRYALRHAAEKGKRRIFFVIPLLAIIEQNAGVIREYVGDDSIVVEHHSNAVRAEGEGELDRRELLCESWRAPIVITTLVQMLDTLFDGRTSCIRRMQALCGSVIIFDEVQTVPPKMLSQFNLAISFLSEVCGATVLLCSATQPKLESAERPIPLKIEGLIERDEKLWECFRRTKLRDAGAMRLDEIPDFLLGQMGEAKSLLVVCNKRDEALALYRAFAERGVDCLHLSASMCMAHRRALVARMREKLANKERFVCVSTQVIEAGVDVSFERSARLLAGMDSAVQTAGRENRNGESAGREPCLLIRCADEKLTSLPDIKRAKDASEALLYEFKREPERFCGELESGEAIARYYELFYRSMKGGAQDFCIKVGGAATSIFELLSTNGKFMRERSRYFLNQAFGTAGREFSVFGAETTDAVAPYGEAGRALIADICSARAARDLGFAKALERRAREYTVSLYDYEKRRLEERSGLRFIESVGIYVLEEEFYDEVTGLRPEGEEFELLEVKN